MGLPNDYTHSASNSDVNSTCRYPPKHIYFIPTHPPTCVSIFFSQYIGRLHVRHRDRVRWSPPPLHRHLPCSPPCCAGLSCTADRYDTTTKCKYNNNIVHFSAQIVCHIHQYKVVAYMLCPSQTHLLYADRHTHPVLLQKHFVCSFPNLGGVSLCAIVSVLVWFYRR